MKVMNKWNNPSVEKGLSLFCNINHENILRYYEYFDHAIEEMDCTCIITEYCEV